MDRYKDTSIRYWSPCANSLSHSMKQRIQDESLRTIKTFRRALTAPSAGAITTIFQRLRPFAGMVLFCRPTFVPGNTPVFDVVGLRRPCMIVNQGGASLSRTTPGACGVGPGTPGPNMGGRVRCGDRLAGCDHGTDWLLCASE
jgi:hypothetical protein